MVNPVDIGLRIAQALDGIGIKLGNYIGKSSNVKKAMFGGKSTMFKPNALQALRGEGKNFDDALKLIEEEAQFIVNATDAEKMAFLNNINDYKELGGPLKKDIVASKQFEEGIGSLKDDIESLQTTTKTMKDDAEKGLASAEKDLKDFLDTGGQPLKAKSDKYLGGSMHEEGQLRTAIRTFLKNEYKNGRIKLDETDKFRVMEYSPMMEDDPIKVFKKIYGDEAYNKAGSFPGAFEKGEDFNHYEKIFKENMGEDLLKVKDKKYVGDGTLVLTKQEEVVTPTPDEDTPFAKGGRAALSLGGPPKMFKGVMEIIKMIKTKMSPMGAMKELNKIIGKKGEYSNLTQKDIDQIVEETNDFIFQRDPDDLYVDEDVNISQGMIDLDELNPTKNAQAALKKIKEKSVDDMSFEDSIKEMEGLGATKTAERFKLKQKYPGLDDDLLTNIIEDTDPVHKASVLAKIDMAMELGKTNKSADEIIDILKKEPDTKMATGGRAGYYGGGQAMIEPDLSDIGHGSDSLMARTRITAPGSQATTSTGLNYLLGEDNDNIRVPFNEGLSVKPSDSMMVDTTTSSPDFYNTDKFEKDSMTYLKGMYGTGQDSNKFLYNEMIKKGNELRKQGVDRETVIEIIRKNKNKIDEILRQQEFKDISPKSLAGLANGGRINFQGGGGADMSTVADSKGNVGAKSVNVSPSGSVTTSRTRGPDAPDDRSNFTQNVNHRDAMRNYQKPPESKLKNLANTAQEINYLNNLYKMNVPGLAISYGINRFGPSIMEKLKNLRSEADIEEEEGIMQMAGGYTIPTEGKLGLNLMDYNTLKNSGYSDGQIEELQLNPDINTEEVIRDIKGPIFAAAKGGIAGLRQGYSKGKGVDLARRGFLKVLGGTVGAIAAFKSGALKLLGKSTTKAAPKLFTVTEGSGAPAWFEGMVNKVLADGVDITKKAATMDGQTVKSLDTPTGKVDVTIDRTGNVDVNYTGDSTALGEGVDMRYVVGQADETTKVKPGDDFEAVEFIPEGKMTGPDDYNVEFGENVTSDVKGLYSDTSELAELGGQKPLIKDISTTIKKKQTLKKMNENPTEFANNNLRDDFPDYDYSE